MTSPAFSPDGQSVAFYAEADMALKRIALSGGTAVTICPAANPYGVSWGPDGIVFGQGRDGILRVSPDGGKPELLARVTSDEVAHGPQMMPGGLAVLFTIGSRSSSNFPQWDKAKVVVQDLSSMERTVVIDGASDAHYVPTGHLVYAVGGVLFAVPFDERRRRVTGGHVPIVEGVRRTTPTGTAHFAFSTTGSLVYVPGPVSALSLDLAWAGRESGIAPMKLPARPYESPRISPDGRHVAVGTNDSRDANVWIHDVTGTASMRQLTFGGRNRYPIWSADGQRIAFQSDREGDLAIFWQRADGIGTVERLTRPEPGASHIPESWAPKSDRFLFSERKGPSISLWTSGVQDKTPTPFDTGQSSASPKSVFSPDGRWVAYAVVKNGAFTLFVEPFPTTGAKNLISTGFHPLWSPDGKELFFSRSPGPGQTMVVRIATQPGLTFGNPEPVLRAAAIDGDPGQARNYDITPDGQRFITVVRPQQTIIRIARRGATAGRPPLVRGTEGARPDALSPSSAMRDDRSVKRRLIQTLACVVVCLVARGTPAVLAQAVGQLTGVVRDTTGAVLPGVAVTVTGTALAAPRTVVTNELGRYELDKLPVGRYVVEATLSGFEPHAVEIAIDGGTATRDVVLVVSSFSESVTVTATKTGAADIQSTPVAITALSANTIEQLGIQAVEGLVGFVPTLTVTQSPGGRALITIRGVGTNSGAPAPNPVLPCMSTACTLLDLRRCRWIFWTSSVSRSFGGRRERSTGATRSAARFTSSHGRRPTRSKRAFGSPLAATTSFAPKVPSAAPSSRTR